VSAAAPYAITGGADLLGASAGLATSSGVRPLVRRLENRKEVIVANSTANGESRVFRQLRLWLDQPKSTVGGKARNNRK
jgi:hypothetical protein